MQMDKAAVDHAGRLIELAVSVCIRELVPDMLADDSPGCQKLPYCCPTRYACKGRRIAEQQAKPGLFLPIGRS